MIYEKHCIPIGADQIALHRFYTCKTDVPVLLLHGSIENGKIFFTKGGKGLAPYLSQLGFDVYVPDMRGKGESLPKISSKHNHSQFEQITVDIPKYLEKIQKQSGVMIFREIQPEYAVPVGVWQVREGVREAMKKTPQETNSLNEAISLATKRMSISKNEWLAHGNMLKLVAQTNMSDFF